MRGKAAQLANIRGFLAFSPHRGLPARGHGSRLRTADRL